VNFQFEGWGKKHVCGCEGTVAGKGSHTLAFVRLAFSLFPSLSLCSKNFLFHRVGVCFLGLLVTFSISGRFNAAYTLLVNRF
jgi:hypothetical protein